MRAIAIIIIVLGVIGVTWGGFSRAQDQGALNLGIVKFTAEDKERVTISPVLGFGALIVGGVLLGVSTRKGGRVATRDPQTDLKGNLE